MSPHDHHLVASSITYRYPKGPVVLDNLSLEIIPGAITAVVGPNGAGKSTLLRILAGVLSPESGSVTLGQSSVTDLPTRARASRIAYIAQRSTLAFDFDVRHVVSFGRLALTKDPSAIDRALERFELTDLADRPVGALSVGQQQRVALARAFAQLDSAAHAYLLADEPTSAMDPRHQLDTIDALRALADRGVGVVLVAHDLSLAARCADRAILLNDSGSLHTHDDATTALSTENLAQIFQTPFTGADINGQRVLIPINTPGT